MRESDLTVDEQKLALKRMRSWEERERLKVEALPPEEQDVVLELVALLNVKPAYKIGGGDVLAGTRSGVASGGNGRGVRRGAIPRS